MELLQAVTKTTYPDGKTRVYEHGMILTKRTTDGINGWYKWLAMLAAKHKWR